MYIILYADVSIYMCTHIICVCVCACVCLCVCVYIYRVSTCTEIAVDTRSDAEVLSLLTFMVQKSAYLLNLASTCTEITVSTRSDA
jgi:hypothetical protein